MMKLLTFFVIALMGSSSARLLGPEASGVQDSISNSIVDNPVTSNYSSLTCTSRVCWQAAKDILNRMDESLDPCNDFYEFSCGNFLKHGSVSDEYPRVSTKIIRERLAEMKNLDENSYNSETLRKMRSFSQQCLDHGYDDTVHYFKKVFDKQQGWPILERKWSEKNFDWLQLFGVLKRENLTVPYPVDIEELGMARIVFLKDLDMRNTNDSQRLQQMVDLAVSFGANEEVAKKDMTDCLIFENQLIQAMLSEPLKITVLRNLNKTGSWFPWDEILDYIEDPTIIKLRLVYTHQEWLIPKLGNILEKTSKRTQANYMMLRSIEGNLEDISVDYLKRMRNELSSELWCAKSGHEYFLIPMVSQYLNRYPHTIYQDHIVSSGIVGHLKMQYVKEMKKVPGHYPDSIFSKVEELYKNLQIVLGYPTILLNETLIDEMYLDFQPKSGNFFELVRKVKTMSHQPLSGFGWADISRLLADNAYFIDKGWVLRTYQIVLSLTRISPPFYSDDYPAFMNYGRLGTTFGHELAHALIGVPLSALNRTHQNKKCIENQYSSFSVNSSLSNDEDIADNAGFRLAYNAYLDILMQQNGVDLKLPNLNYTPQQMFWISTATSFCEISQQEQGDIHSHNRIRINNVFSNLKEFRDDFKCSENSFMYSTNECTGF